MVKIDFDKQAADAQRANEELLKKRKKLEELADKHYHDLRSEGLVFGIVIYNGMDYGFNGTLPREKCYFDDKKLKAIGPITTDSGNPPRRLYECSKCEKLYMLPLGEKERVAYRKHSSKMIFN